MGKDAVTLQVGEHGLPCVWVVWAVSGNGSHQPTLVAICSTEEKAEGYRLAVEQNFAGDRFHAEQAPVDHLFGAADLRSVAFRRALRETSRKRAGG